MKIAYFTDTYIPEINGITNTLQKLGDYLDRKQIHQLIIAPDYDKKNPNLNSEYRKVHRFSGFQTHLSPKSRLAFPAFWDIDSILDKYKPDIIHVTTEFGIGFRGMRYAKSRNIPLVMSFHTDYIKYLKYHNLDIFQSVIESYLSWFYGFSGRILVPSTYTLEELFNKGFKNLDIWSRGIDTSRFNPNYKSKILRRKLRKDKFVFLYAGRLSAEKNLDMLINAAEFIDKKYPEKTLFIFTGDGPYTKVIKNRKLKNTAITGFKKGKALSKIYASCDCFAFPSGTETFGNVVLEAMASRLPVAAVNSGGITDFLKHEENSLLSAYGNTEEFTNNLIRIMNDPELRERLAENAYQTALSRDWNKIFDNLLKVYIEVIESKK